MKYDKQKIKKLIQILAKSNGLCAEELGLVGVCTNPSMEYKKCIKCWKSVLKKEEKIEKAKKDNELGLECHIENGILKVPGIGLILQATCYDCKYRTTSEEEEPCKSCKNDSEFIPKSK